MRNLPLRWKLALHTAGLACVVLLLFGLGVSWHLYNGGIAEIDKDMRLVARGFFNELEKGRPSMDWKDPLAVDSLFPVVTTLYAIEVLDHGTVVYRSRVPEGQPFPILLGRRAFASAKLAGKSVRVSQFESRDVTLRLVAEIHTVEESRRDLLRSYLIAAPVALLLTGLGAWWIARRALAPVDEIAAAAERITAQRLDRRLPVPSNRGDEIDRLTTVLNQMFDRLEGSFLQATRFTADASHELKTPLTIIRGEIEAELRAGAHSPSQEKMLVDVLEETTRLVSITEGLLLLSRADSGKLQLSMESLDLSEVLSEMIEDIEILAERKSINIEADIPPSVWVTANAQFLRQLLLNLFDNALKYNHSGGCLRACIIAGTATHQIAIANTGTGLSEEQALRVFDRFYRGDASRDSSIGGHGLGLSICREIARAFHGEIALHLSEAGWTEFRVTLPASSRPQSEPVSRQPEEVRDLSSV